MLVRKRNRQADSARLFAYRNKKRVAYQLFTIFPDAARHIQTHRIMQIQSRVASRININPKLLIELISDYVANVE